MRSVPLVCLQCRTHGEQKSDGKFISCTFCKYTEKARTVPFEKGLLIKVNKKDIKKAEDLKRRGAKNPATWDPVAQALVRHGYSNVSIALDYFCANGKVFSTTDEIKNVVIAFDLGEQIKPSCFMIEDL
jgi:hypothetical protein